MINTAQHQHLRADLRIIADMVTPGIRVLDVGCGDGALLSYLAQEKSVDARGIELDQDGVRAAVARGLSVVQGDADTDLANYPSDGFDMAILSQTLQATHQPRVVLESLSRIAPQVVVSIPNFGHWRIRLSLLFNGRMPTTPALPKSWYETANIHLCTLRDFAALADELGLVIERMVTLDAADRACLRDPRKLLRVNWLAEQAIFLLRRG